MSSVCQNCRSSVCVCHVKVCNCARCGAELTSDRQTIVTLQVRRAAGDRGVRTLALLAGREDGRPYCARCIPIQRDPAEAAEQAHACRSPGQRAKLGSVCG